MVHLHLAWRHMPVHNAQPSGPAIAYYFLVGVKQAQCVRAKEFHCIDSIKDVALKKESVEFSTFSGNCKKKINVL